ncbi:HAMP domain-containing sensor histidine kinase [Pedobacter sp. Leaf170]|uniref:HAMP domain-containing sensor histidine kinase n=1 Tax=Pedobacter sp. Leaf170 TaxID=2876558 RepID=UPI001E5E9056|nr:HAMP domain-containing sensor histidine kinase [Pedobacter sp. Leaf170]
MKIKDRLALYFTLICTSILLAVLFTVYFTFMKFLQADFFERLTDRTMVTAKLYLEADEISRDALNTVRHKYLQKLNSEVIRIYDKENRATFIGDSAQYWPKSTIELVRKRKHLKYTDGERQVVGIYYKDNQGDFVILASAEDLGSHNRLSKLWQIMIIVFIMIFAFVLLLSRWIAEKMLKPLNKFLADVKQIDAKNMAFRVEEKANKDEINQIAKTFNNLMEELEQAFILQKTFVANASHELRTPLTRMIMNAELTLSKQREMSDYQNAIHSMLEESEKMEHIITGLLALAKMDMELIHSQRAEIIVDDLISSIKTDWQHERGLNLKVIVNDEVKNLKVLANNTLIRIALDNIISNAFKFSKNDEVIFTAERAEQELRIHIQDNGTGINPKDVNNIFQPFYSKSKEFGLQGEGMGLYITQKIIEIFKGTIELTPANPRGCVFTIKLPLINPLLISV